MLTRGVGVLFFFVAGLFWGGGSAQDAIDVTSPVSGDVFEPGDEVLVEWEAALDSSTFDVSLLNDGSQVGDMFCDDGGCLAPNGFLMVTLPTGLESGTAYSFLVGDRSQTPTIYGASENFEILASDDDNGADGTAGDEQDGDQGPMMVIGVACGAVAFVLVAVCIMVRCGCCTSRRDAEKPSKVRQGDVGNDRLERANSHGPEQFQSGGGSSDGGVSLAGLIDIGALSPVPEENVEVVTKNPMRAAMANGAQFHSGASSSKFQSGADSSKFQSSLGGDSSRRGDGDEEDEEGGGMFADADVVAKLAAAAAQQVEKDNPVRIQKASGTASGRVWHQGSGGGWVRTPSRHEDTGKGFERVKSDQDSNIFARVPGVAEEKAAEAASADSVSTQAPSTAWIVSTSRSFDGKPSTEATGWISALDASDTANKATVEGETKASSTAQDNAAVGRANAVAPATVSAEEEKKEELADARPRTAVGTSEGCVASAGEIVGQVPAHSPLLVDGVSPSAFGRAEVVANSLPTAIKERAVASEPECEVPKPGALGADNAREKPGDYTWLYSSGRNGKEGTEKEQPGKAAASTPSRSRSPLTAPPGARASVRQAATELPRGPATKAEVSPRSILPTEATAERSERADSGPSSWCTGDRRPWGAPEQHEPVLSLPPKAQGSTPRRALLTPRGSASRGFNASAPDRLPPIKSPSAHSPTRPSWLAPLGTPDRVSRVSQVVQAFEKLSPRAKAAPLTPAPLTPGSRTPGAAAWTTPVATPDRTPRAGRPPPEEMSKGVTPSGEAGRGWTTPVATPDRTPTASAPYTGRKGVTPERTTKADGAPAVAKTDVSPTDEKLFAWQLESPAGVDGLPSPSESDLRAISARNKAGRPISAIFGAVGISGVDTTPVQTPSSVNRGAYHRMNSSGDSSSGAGWEVEARGSSQASLRASQVAAFVADARAEAAAEARAAAAEAAAEVAEEEARAIKEHACVAKEEARAAAGETRATAEDETVTTTVKPVNGAQAATETTAAAVAKVMKVGTNADGSRVDAQCEPGRGQVTTSLGGLNTMLEDGKGTQNTKTHVQTTTEENRGAGEVEEVTLTLPGEITEVGKMSSPHGSEEVAALVAEAMGLAAPDRSQMDVVSHVTDESGEIVSDGAKQVDNSSSGVYEASPLATKGAREAEEGGTFRSNKSILTWSEEEGMEEGDAERDAEEVQALVAEALALVRQASQDAM